MNLSKGAGNFIWRPAKAVYFILAFLVSVMILTTAIHYLQPDLSQGFLSGKKGVFHSWYKYFFYVHIFAGPFALFAGLLQFTLSTKQRVHRYSGYVYFGSVMLAAPAGLAMSFVSIGGLASGVSFMLLAVLWVVFTAKAFASIKNGDVPAHRTNMIRSFILANSAVILRISSFISNHYLELDPVNAYIFISWFCWVPWLLGYEWLRMRNNRPEAITIIAGSQQKDKR